MLWLCTACVYNSNKGWVMLFADAETGEDFAQQFIAAHGAGYLSQAHLALPQVFSQQFTRPGIEQLLPSRLQETGRGFQGLQMSPAGAEVALALTLETHACLEVVTQKVDAGTGFSR